MENLRLYMLLLGCKPPGRYTEQHDIFFGIAASLRDLLPDILDAWPEAPKIHIDAWREVTEVDGYAVQVVKREEGLPAAGKLFFLNLGGYKPGEFEEYHYKLLCIAPDKAQAVEQAKQTAFFKHTGFSGANAHIDDKYGVDVDDLYEIADILPAAITANYRLEILQDKTGKKDEWHLGYTKLSSLV